MSAVHDVLDSILHSMITHLQICVSLIYAGKQEIE